VLIKEALRRGHYVEVLDEAANFIRITGNGKVEYLCQATRTAADTYVSALIMENKNVTKQLLAEADIRVPAGNRYTSVSTALSDFAHWSRQDIVVKPNTTNFGIAVTLLHAPIAEEDFSKAVEMAFREDSSVLVEAFIPGKEYRFLVVDGAVRGVLHRMPANVCGDSVSTVAELVAAKNQDPKRGVGYHSPLEKIRLGEEELQMLRSQDLDLAAIPEAGRTVFLRKNSNISTGGDSIDMTDAVHPGYKALAAAATAAVGSKISGVDMIIADVSAAPAANNYAIIELNFNPALHIHDFPAQGINREVEKSVLDLLGL
jgi:glutamate--cysteine ligase